MSCSDMEQVRSTACWTVFGVAVILALVGMPIPAQAEWSAIAEQKTSYTTNALQFSSARRLHIADLGRESLAVLSRAWQAGG